MRIPKPRRESRPKKRRKKTRHQWLFEECKDVARAIVRHRDDWKCQDQKYRAHSCKGGVQWAHLISRAFHRLCCELDNSVMLCAGAHFYYGKTPRGKERWPDWCEKHLGKERWSELKTLRDAPARPLRVADLEDMLAALRDEARKRGLM